MASIACPQCTFPMLLVRVFETPGDGPPTGVYFCRPCNVCEVEPVVLTYKIGAR